jgi:hypothetical protein
MVAGYYDPCHFLPFSWVVARSRPIFSDLPKNWRLLQTESKRVIDIDEFVPKKKIDELYLNSLYYIRGPVADNRNHRRRNWSV